MKSHVLVPDPDDRRVLFERRGDPVASFLEGLAAGMIVASIVFALMVLS